jgi:hypothetical protein
MVDNSSLLPKEWAYSINCTAEETLNSCASLKICVTGRSIIIVAKPLCKQYFWMLKIQSLQMIQHICNKKTPAEKPELQAGGFIFQ